jgi:hypothetical protein
MAFGKMIESIPTYSSPSAAQQTNVFINTREGKRIIRFLPDLVNPTEPMIGPTVLSVWMPVAKNGQLVQRRIFVDSLTRAVLPAKVNEAVRCRFFMNVLDKSMVVKLENGSVVYANNQNQFITVLDGQTQTLTSYKPERHMAIQVLEGSVSSGEGRNGMLNDIEELSKTIFDDDTGKLIPITEIDIEIITRGKEIKTTRSVHVGTNRDPIPGSLLSAPRFDLAKYARPFPMDAVKDLVKGADYGDVCKAYNSEVMPKLAETPELF